MSLVSKEATPRFLQAVADLKLAEEALYSSNDAATSGPGKAHKTRLEQDVEQKKNVVDSYFDESLMFKPYNLEQAPITSQEGLEIKEQ